MLYQASPHNVSLHFLLSHVNWWVFTIVLGVLLLLYSIFSRTWTSFVVWISTLLVFTVVSALLKHQEIVSGASAKQASNVSFTLRFSDVNWWIFELLLLAIFVILGLRQNIAAWFAAGIMVVLGLLFGLYYGIFG